ncbi:T9SS type A sorting domain-containing protein [Rasiella rasia]|uniref:T9SS type A sorting domain-containing protein n=1 Tax=Rasiella rasia TaxID=2744027 RepID=A0A6G6GN94_9FLAO|nr:T9SS type A sorting domain-containing protein [Rasiella rasia]QIE60055.1 T9SS type A sorting domain-containing protein [Rasiella rasia]
MKYIFLLLFLTVNFASFHAQNFEDEWTGHFSYVSIQAISQGNDKIYAAAENAIFSYDLSTQEIETLSTINGLSGNLISTLYYSEEYGLLIIGYENGLMEVVIDGDENILTVVDILNKPTIPPNQKRINQFNEYDGNLYIATDFGISVFDLGLLEFGDTYFIGDLGSQINITGTAVQGSFIYAATRGNGIRRAMVNDDNLIDFEQWTQIAGGTYLGITQAGNQVYTANTNQLYSVIGGLQIVATTSEQILEINGQNNLINLTTANTLQTYDETIALVASSNSINGVDEYELQTGFSHDNKQYLGTSELGLFEIPFANSQATQILPDGPLFNSSFSIDASPGQVWVNFGDVTVSFDPFPITKKGISNLREGEWFNIPYEELTETLNKEANDLVRVKINPNNANEVFMTSFQKGILQIDDQNPIKLFDESNSSLQITDGNPNFGIRIFGLDYDRQGNLWAVQAKDEKGLIKITPEGQLIQNDISSVFNFDNPPLALTEVATTRENFVFFGANTDGLVAFNPANGQVKKIGTEIGNGNLPDNTIRALATDNNNRLWIGTLKGLRVLFNPGSFFEEGANIDTQAIIILEDGVPQELLFEQVITDIEVDGSNNKWIATASSGVFYLSPNGQETLLRFTAENSPLPSNNVQGIAIDSFTGVVYFATVNGLVAFKGTSTAPRDNLEGVYAYPNPVRPGFTGNVTIDGLTANANVKITDIEGSLVFETTSEGGSVLWDTTAFGKYKVASGVYLVIITAEDALETKISKIMVIR